MVSSGPYPLEARREVEALLHDPALTLLMIAGHTGISYDTVKRWNRKARIRRPRRMPARSSEAIDARRGDGPTRASGSGGLRPASPAPSLGELDAALRTHIARQIAAFDDALGRAGNGLDTARVLRDLGGLKRLLDDIGARAGASDGDGDANGDSPQDLAALRADLARRYEAFEAGGHAAEFSGDPAGEPSQGAGR